MTLIILYVGRIVDLRDVHRTSGNVTFIVQLLNQHSSMYRIELELSALKETEIGGRKMKQRVIR
jgi:hypothetical protein